MEFVWFERFIEIYQNLFTQVFIPIYSDIIM